MKPSLAVRPLTRPLLCAVLGAGLLALPRLAHAGPIQLIANETASMNYPSSDPGSIGNESGAGFSDLHTVTQSGPLTASLSETRSGVDGSGGVPYAGTAGTTTIAGSTTTEAGRITATSSAHADSTPNPAGLAFLPHGGASVEGFGRFNDAILISNPDYAGLVPVTLHLKMTWQHTVDIQEDRRGVDFMQDWAIAQMGLDFFGSITLYNLVRTDGVGYERIELEGSLSGDAYANNWLGLWGNLDVLASAAVNIHGTVGSPYAEANAFSSAEAFYTIEAPTNTVITSQSGHDYTYRAAAASVPDATPSLALLAAGLGALGLVAPRKKRPTAVAGA